MSKTWEARAYDEITFDQACFMSGMSADTLAFLASILTDEQKDNFIQNERETITDEGYMLAKSNELYPKGG